MEQTLGKRIVANRKRLGLTQDQLAERLGVTAQAVSKWENGQSCPDITMLPKLAAIFNITTDQLLGITPQEEAPAHRAEVVTEENEPEGIHLSNGKWEFKYDSGRKGRFGLALWILLVGGLLLSSALLGWESNFWSILWPSALLVFGLMGLLPKFSFFRLGCALFGGYYLLVGLHVPILTLGKELVLPIFLLLFGMSLLVDALRKKSKPEFHAYHNGKPIHTGEKKHTTNLTQEGTRFFCSTSFGENTYAIELEQLTQGEASVSFGELTVDLTGCKEIADNCAIVAECSFGELTILVPASCHVIPTQDTSFASVSIQGAPAQTAKTIINMDCDVSFGEIVIRYV